MIWGQSMHNEIAVGEVNTRCYASNTYVVETGSRASMFFARLNDKCRFFLSVGRQNRPGKTECGYRSIIILFSNVKSFDKETITRSSVSFSSLSPSIED